MSEPQPSLGRRQVEPPANTDLGAWAAGEVTKHEELCGLRYEAIAKDMAAMRLAMAEGQAAAAVRTKAIEDKIGGAIRWVMGIVASLAVALILMSIKSTHDQTATDEADKREMRARLSLLTQQLANVQPHGTVVVAPPGSQTTSVPGSSADPPPLDPGDLGAAAGDKGK